MLTFSSFEILILRKALKTLGYKIYDDLYHEVGTYCKNDKGENEFMFDEGIYVSNLPFSLYERLDELILLADQQQQENKSYKNELESYITQ